MRIEKDTMTTVARGLPKSLESDENDTNAYIDESLLPRFKESVEYDDE